MRYFFSSILLLCSYNAFNQEVQFEKGKDTIYVGEKDTLATVSFKIDGTTTVELFPSMSIKVHSGQAVQGRDFVLRDAYDKTTPEITITKLKNRTGSFQVYVTGGLKEAKTVNLQTMLYDEQRQVPDILKLTLAPFVKKAAAEKPKAEKKDSLKFVQHNLINIQVWEDDKKELKRTVKRPVFPDKNVNQLINVSRIKITRESNTNYRIEVVSTENEVYFATLEINPNYTFKQDNKLFLNGISGSSFILVQDIFYLEKENASDTSKAATNPETKFALQ